MNLTKDLYRSSLILLTDLYQLTMAQGYWKAGLKDRQAVFHLFFRENPFQGGFVINAGLEFVVDFLEEWNFADEDIDYLRTLKGNDGQPLFERGFLEYLAQMDFHCDVKAIPEGTVVFPFEPLISVEGPIVQCQILETFLLTNINFQSLITTKAARILIASRGEPVLEFGLRRAQGNEGGVSASRAAYIGGCAATSNVLAGKLLGIPVKGTHAHSWVMTFNSEMEAFQTYAQHMPNNTLLLVDTYDTLQGVQHAIEIGRWLRSQGHKLAGIRLDSGDLAYLSIEARKILDAAGFENVPIVASNDLDEYTIRSLKEQNAQISVWGVGTRLATAYDQPALGGVYKLAALQDAQGEWQDKVKLSEQTTKINNPGPQQVRRFFREGEAKGDMIFNTHQPLGEDVTMIDPADHTRRKHFSAGTDYQDLLVPVFEGGRCVFEKPTLGAIREKAMAELEHFHQGIKRFENPHAYPVGLEKSMYFRKTDLVLRLRNMET